MLPHHHQSNWRSSIVLLLSAIVLLLTFGVSDAAATTPTCRLKRPMFADHLRSPQLRGALIQVEGDPTNFNNQPNVNDTIALNKNITNSESILDPSRKLVVDFVDLSNTTIDGSLIALYFKLQPNYWLAGVNDSVSVNLSSSFFMNGIPCPEFHFKIYPSAGTIDTSKLPATDINNGILAPGIFSEIKLNNEDITFELHVGFDQFLPNAEAWFVNPLNFSITQEVPPFSEVPAQNVMRFTVKRNDTYNPAVNHVDRLTIIFNKYMMKSGVAPIIGDGITETDVTIQFKGVQPTATVIYQTAAGAMLSEDLWDGNAWCQIILAGDTFVVNDSLWESNITQPTYTAAKPIAPYGFDFFLQRGMRPSFNITSRSVNLTFPPLIGFAIPSVVDQMKMTGLGQVTSEKQTIPEVSLRVLRVKDSSPFVIFGGMPWRNNSDGTIGISEVDVRRTGFNVSLFIKYNVWVEKPGDNFIRDMIKSYSLPTSTLIRYIDTKAYVIDRLRLDLVTPAQKGYDIGADETMNITVPAVITETRQPLVNNSALFNISQFVGASTCSISTPQFIYESDVRNMTGRQLNVTISIISGTDQFCINPASERDLNQSRSVITGPGQRGPDLSISYVYNDTRNITMVINKNPNFEITGNVYLTIELPASIMCSIEICTSEQSGASGGSRLQLFIGAVSGKLIGQMPTVTEAFMRTQIVRTLVEFVGDAFNLGTVGSTRGDIQLKITVDPVDIYGRGFVASFPDSVLKLTVDGNLTQAQFTLQPNASYDIVNAETIWFTILSVRTASQISPDSQIVPLRILPLPGVLNVVYPNLTTYALPPAATSTTIAAPTGTLGPNQTTTTTTTTTTTATTLGTTTTSFNSTNSTNGTAAPGPTEMPWFINVTESEILNGNITINITLTNDRFDVPILPATVRARLTLHTKDQPSGIDSNKGVILADNAFYFDKNQFFMSVNFQKAPLYDITEPESFTISFDESVLVSRGKPASNANVTIHVMPDPGKLKITGDAVLVSSFDIVNGDRNFTITLEGDKFKKGVDAFIDRSELCTVVEGGEFCTIDFDSVTRRNLTVRYDPFSRFFISRNTTYTIKLRPEYFDSGVVPIGDTNVTVYLSGGKIEWFLMFARVSEAEVRDGAYTDLTADKAIAKARISGDKFAAKDEVRRALAESVECCILKNGVCDTTAAPNPYGFCARARSLFGSIYFNILDADRVVDVVLQPDKQFDIYAEEKIKFVAGGGATQSRLQPIVAATSGVKSGEMVIYPTQGKYFISTSFVYISEQDISSPALASRMKLSVSLFGERWLANVTRVVELVVAQMISDVGSKEINGWERYRSSIFPALTAGKVDELGRLLELQFVAAQRYDVFNPETVTINVPAAAVLSPYAPALDSVQKGFTIDTVGGILTGQPHLTTIEVIPPENKDSEEQRYVLTVPITPTVKVVQEHGFNVTLQLARDTWDEVNLYSDWQLVYNAFSSSKTPQEEGNGFAVYKDRLLSPKDPISPVPGNGTHRWFLLNRVPEYNLLDPERIRIDLVLFWTQQGNGGKATTPSYFEFLIMPEFPYVEASVKSYFDLTNTNDTAAMAYLENWKKEVAEKLAIIPSRVIIIESAKEWMAPNSPYYRIRFRVADVSDPDIPYDNSVTRLFTSWNREFLEKNFNVSFAFYNASPPEENQWLTLEGAGGIPDNSEAVGIVFSAIIYFIVGIIVALLIIYFVRRYNQGKHKNGLNWGESEGHKKANSRFADSHETEERNFDTAAELLFAGQRELVPYLADDDAAKAAREDAKKDAFARKHGIIRQQTATTFTGNPSDKGYRLRKHNVTGDGRDELAFFDVPENIYSGQSKVVKHATDADVGMSLIDRMVTSGTDHSTRISRTGQSRLQNLTELMSPREVEMASRNTRPTHDFGSPSEAKARDPVLFGSERRINDLLNKVGGDSNTSYMTNLKTQLVDSGVTPIHDKNSANRGPQLWSDQKADDIVLPPHLVGKVSRFRPPSERKY